MIETVKRTDLGADLKWVIGCETSSFVYLSTQHFYKKSKVAD